MNELIEKKIPFLNQSIFLGKLTNGFTVCLQPRNEYHEVFASLAVDFGSADAVFYSENDQKKQVYPAGIAHFLEHKMFESENGQDVLQEFSKFGANANAFTSLYQTTYFFSTTKDYLSSLTLLQEFITKPYFTKESIEKEKEIISQEILMYQDDPDSRLFVEILSSLYPNIAIADDIAGSIDSIRKIRLEDLLENFNYFYQPQKMTLFVTGNIDVKETWSSIQAVQSRIASRDEKVTPCLELAPIKEHGKLYLEVAMPKLAIGIRSQGGVLSTSLLRYKTCLSLLFSMLFGWTSDRYQALYQSGKIDSSFSFHLEIRNTYQFFVLTVDSSEPIALSSQLKKAIVNFEKDPTFSEEHLSLIKKEALGDYIRSLNSLEATAMYFSANASPEARETIFDLPNILEEIALEDVMEAGRYFLSDGELADFIIFPK
ncbi:EF-P 5-aminopentanol modification-associated protein YfmH [Streptococcus cameli]